MCVHYTRHIQGFVVVCSSVHSCPSPTHLAFVDSCLDQVRFYGCGKPISPLETTLGSGRKRENLQQLWGRRRVNRRLSGASQSKDPVHLKFKVNFAIIFWLNASSRIIQLHQFERNKYSMSLTLFFLKASPHFTGLFRIILVLRGLIFPPLVCIASGVRPSRLSQIF